LVVDLTIIIYKNKSIFDLIFDFKYYLPSKIKLLFYALLKYIGVFIWIISAQVNQPVIAFYGKYFYFYFIISIIIRLLTKGQKSLLFYFLNFKNT
jgi:hypothetical protein